MQNYLTRRSLLLASVLPVSLPRLEEAFALLEQKHGGRLGVALRDTGSSRQITYSADQRYPMCSTHKFITVAAILHLVDTGTLRLDHSVPYTRADMLNYAPIARQHLDAGVMTVEALCAAALRWSDNTAANLLLRLLGGPAGWTRYARSIGDDVSRLDRFEPDLNSAVPGDLRDTTTPAAMLDNLHIIWRGSSLSTASREYLRNWMLDSPVTGQLLRAGLPASWQLADKSGSGDHGTRNDIGIIFKPSAAPILASVFYTGTLESTVSQDAVIAEIARLIPRLFDH